VSVPDTTAPYWSRDVDDLSTSLGSGSNGLTAARAAEQLAVVGPNSVEDAQRLGPLRLLWRQVESPLVLILIFAAALSLSLSEWVDAAIILAIVIGSTLLGFYQEYRASAAVEELKKRLALTCRVVRDGVEGTVRADVLVPGDVLVLSAGNLIPADGRILEARDFLVSEASMTGESFPVEKQPGVVPADTPLAQRTNVVFLGASVRSGTARVLVTETGRRTAFGAIAARLRAREPETNFARGLRQFGYLLIRAMVVIVLSVLTVNLLLHRPLVESLLFSVALAVGLSPELLPAIVSVTLAAGARAMSKQGVIVRRLDAIENLGSMSVLCTDKTGTLTEGTIRSRRRHRSEGTPSAAVRQLAFLNASFETGIDNPIDAAIVSAGEQAGLSTAGHAKIDEIPYDFLRKCLTIVMAEGGDAERHLVVTKGAFSNVLSCLHPGGARRRDARADGYRGRRPCRVLRVERESGLPRAGARDACRVGEGRLSARRRDGNGLRGFPALPRPAQGRRRPRARRPREVACRREGHHGRQPVRDGPSRRDRRARPDVDAHW
jgi:Mg2+-importing ATPase